jgi:hypothetical protein
MSKRAVWVTGFLSVTALAVGAELWAALDDSPDTVPWTNLIAQYVPWPITAAAIAILVAWLPTHFIHAYRRAHRLPATVQGGTDMTPDPPVPVPARNTAPLDAPPPAPDPNTTSEEPLLGVGTITTVVGILLSLAVALGLRVSPTAQVLILGATTSLAPIIVALIGRRKVWSPASVARLVAAQRR